MFSSSSSTSSNGVVETGLKTALSNLGVADDLAQRIWHDLIRSHHTEPIRAYHNLDHLAQLIGLATQYHSLINDKEAVILAILFHDIIYDPTSSINEELSAALFEKTFDGVINDELRQKVSQYIIATKYHSISGSMDMDLKLFIDFDMSILGSPFADYQAYTDKIRCEYSHVSDVDFCTGRAAFLRKTLKSAQDQVGGDNRTRTPIFATEEMRSMLEAQAIRNMEWEINHLDQRKEHLLSHSST